MTLSPRQTIGRFLTRHPRRVKIVLLAIATYAALC